MDGPIPPTADNALEAALIAAKRGDIPLRQLLSTLLESDIAVPSATEVRADGSGLKPLLFDKEGTAMVAVFSSLARAKKFASAAQYALIINARLFLRGLSSGVGVVVNPGFADGVDMSAEGIRNVLNDFTATR